MPLYEYICEECGSTTEIIQKFDDPPPVCETCVKEKNKTIIMKKLLSTGTSFILKGKGWYKTDYRK